MAYKLSEGCLMEIVKGKTSSNILLQVFAHHSVTKGSERIREVLEVSDGKYSTLAVLQASHLLDRVTVGQLQKHAILNVGKYTSTVMTCTHGEKWHFLELLSFKIVVEQRGGNNMACRKIGTPIRLLWPANGLRGLLGNGPVFGSGNCTQLSCTSPHRIFPIEGLHSYITKAVICARVVSKSPLRSWMKPGKGEGKLFSMDLADNTGSIQATVFNEIAPAFYDLMEVNHVYFIQNYLVKTAYSQHAKTLHPCEISFIERTAVCEFVRRQEQGAAAGAVAATPAAGAAAPASPADVAPLVFNLVPLHWLPFLPEKSKVDLIGVCKSAHEVKEYNTSKSQTSKKRKVYLVDHTNIEVTLTLWGTEAVKLVPHLHPVIAVKNGTVASYRGTKSVSVAAGSVMLVGPDNLPEADRERDWALHQGWAERVPNVSQGGFTAANWMTLQEALSRRVEFFTCLATVLGMEAGPCYEACARLHCRKRVLRTWSGTYRCEGCSFEAPAFQWCFPVQISVADWTGRVSAEAVQQEAQALSGLSTAERMQQRSDGTLGEAFRKARYKSHILRFHCQWSKHEGKDLMKVQVVSAQPVAAKYYNRYLLYKVKKLQAENSGHFLQDI